MKKINIILPVYNEEEVINHFNDALFRTIENLYSQYVFEVIYVLDKSSDNSSIILKDICSKRKNVKLIMLSKRFGHQASLLAGMDACDGDAAIMMDSDMQHPPELIPSMLAEFEKGYDIVYTIRLDSCETGIFKRISSKLFYRAINKISQVPINESSADFRLVSRRVLEIFQNQLREQNQFLRGLFSWVGFNTIGIPFRVSSRAAGSSKYTISRMVRFGIAGVVSFSKRPLQAAIYLGFTLAIFAFLFIGITLVQYIIYAHIPSGWTTIVILISLFSGTQLIFLGIVGEYIAAIFDEVKGRPHYIVQDNINFMNKECITCNKKTKME